ncbi:pickpocket protein 28 [Lucilia sericata]|uniref:pickpocket protein 28 n=1 Tax=Lucilia sericata TaxID=13632 RepID=UPI0018A7F942|nr:pickpocket protein 28 [Lucilia sericata]
MANQIRKKQRKSEIVQVYCMDNIKKYLQETTLHGLKYLADSSLTIWEKLFFFASFVAAVIIVANLISNVYAKWDSTPVIIGISPHPTSILKVPFPAMTLCNMNQVLNSKVANYSEDSLEYDILQFLCFTESEYDERLADKNNIKNNNLRIADFVIKHAQPCARMLIYCQISSIVYNCSELFREVMTDEGLCCVFNTLHPEFLYKGKYDIIKDLKDDKVTKAVNWNPESGYQNNLPEKFYPRPASGTGVSMGLSVILNAELDEYYCSSTNGPGIKISLHNPIETPSVKETGLTVPLGYETRFRIDALGSEAVPSIRSIHRNRRQCVFMNEERLLYYKYYTRRNCESECQAIYLYQQCTCIPYNYPLVYNNATVCTVNESFCINKASKEWTLVSPDSLCLKRCLPGCFDLNFLPDSFSGPLAERNYTIQNSILRNMPKDEMRKNIAIVHFYYRESVFYGDLKNVYIGLTEFLSNIGGIMGLFMGFSFISVAEIVYFSILRPVFKFVLPRKFKNASLKNRLQTNVEVKSNPNWLSHEICKD